MTTTCPSGFTSDDNVLFVSNTSNCWIPEQTFFATYGTVCACTILVFLYTFVLWIVSLYSKPNDSNPSLSRKRISDQFWRRLVLFFICLSTLSQIISMLFGLTRACFHCGVWMYITGVNMFMNGGIIPLAIVLPFRKLDPNMFRGKKQIYFFSLVLLFVSLLVGTMIGSLWTYSPPNERNSYFFGLQFAYSIIQLGYLVLFYMVYSQFQSMTTSKPNSSEDKVGMFVKRYRKLFYSIGILIFGMLVYSTTMMGLYEQYKEGTMPLLSVSPIFYVYYSFMSLILIQFNANREVNEIGRRFTEFSPKSPFRQRPSRTSQASQTFHRGSGYTSIPGSPPTSPTSSPKPRRLTLVKEHQQNHPFGGFN